MCPACEEREQRYLAEQEEHLRQEYELLCAAQYAQYVDDERRRLQEEFNTEGAWVMPGWIGVDLDGTLAEYHGWVSEDHIGAPITQMVERVKRWLREGKDVRIFTARVDGGEVALSMGVEEGVHFRDVEHVKSTIRAWCVEHIGQELPITNVKDFGMIELWDDRAVQVEKNTGERADRADRERFLTPRMLAALRELRLACEGADEGHQMSAAGFMEHVAEEIRAGRGVEMAEEAEEPVSFACDNCCTRITEAQECYCSECRTQADFKCNCCGCSTDGEDGYCRTCYTGKQGEVVVENSVNEVPYNGWSDHYAARRLTMEGSYLYVILDSAGSYAGETANPTLFCLYRGKYADYERLIQLTGCEFEIMRVEVDLLTPAVRMKVLKENPLAVFPPFDTDLSAMGISEENQKKIKEWHAKLKA